VGGKVGNERREDENLGQAYWVLRGKGVTSVEVTAKEKSVTGSGAREHKPFASKKRKVLKI